MPMPRAARFLLCAALAGLWLSFSACSAGTLSPTEGEVGTLAAGQQAGAAPTAAATQTPSQDTHGALPATNAPSTPVPAAASSSAWVLGVLPDYDNKATNGLAGFISRTGIVPQATSGYVNVGPNGAIETQTAIGYIQEAKAQNVPVISLSLTAKQSGALTSEQLAGISAILAEANKQAIQLNLRYGFEMNFGGGDAQYANINNHNDPSDFKTQWAQVAALANPARAASPAVKMVWSPNIASGGTLPYADWEPADPKTIDVVAVDWYHTPGDAMDSTSVVTTLKDIYAVAETLQVPFYLGETGVIEPSTGSAQAQEKLGWLNAITSASVRAQMPLFAGFYWFDYIKGGVNFSLSQDSATLPLFRSWYATTLTTAT